MINDKLLRKWEMDSKQMETWSLLDQETGRRGRKRRIFWILLVYIICPERFHTKINRYLIDCLTDVAIINDHFNFVVK